MCVDVFFKAETSSWVPASVLKTEHEVGNLVVLSISTIMAGAEVP